MSLWKSIYKYKSTTIQNDNEYKDIINEIKNKYGNSVIEIWSDEYIEKLKNCNGYYFQKVNKNLDDVINEKMRKGNYNVWPLREELLEDENISKFLKEKKKKSNIIENEKKSEINYNYLNKKRKSTFVHNQEKNDSINLENYMELKHKIENIELKFGNTIKELEKYIKDLESIILQKNEIIENEKLKNSTLNKKLKELENDSKNNLERIKIELENEINLFRKYYNFSEGEKLISIKFISGEQDINYSIITKNTEKFIKVEYILYEKYPKYTETTNYFLAKGNKINRNETLEQNNIRDNDVITLITNNLD